MQYVGAQLLSDGIVSADDFEYDPDEDSFGIRVRRDVFPEYHSWLYIELMVTGSWRLKQVYPRFPRPHIYYPNSEAARQWCYSGHTQPLSACIAGFQAWDGAEYTEPVNWVKSYDADGMQRYHSQPREGITQQGELDDVIRELRARHIA